MRLPMNITGLANSVIEMNEMDGGLFKKLGYEIARKINGKIIGFISPSYPLNYFRMDIEVDKKVVSILLHQYFPYAAIVLYDNELQLQFIECDNLFTELSPYYTVLEAAFLNELFNPNAHDLSEDELKNVKHWRPKTNGEVIFNCWD